MWDKNMQYDPRQDPWARSPGLPLPKRCRTLVNGLWVTRHDPPACSCVCNHSLPSGEDHSPQPPLPLTHQLMRWGQASPSSLLPPGGSYTLNRTREAALWDPQSNETRHFSPEQSHSATQASKRNLSHLVQAIIRGLGRRPPALHLFTSSPSSAMRACLIASVVSDSLWSHGLWSARLLCPWGFPGKNTGVGRHSLLHPQL